MRSRGSSAFQRVGVPRNLPFRHLSIRFRGADALSSPGSNASTDREVIAMIDRPETGEKILALLRQFGWETTLVKLREEIGKTDDLARRDELRFFAGWMAAERGAYVEAL